jgi:hypothetical protein
MYSICTTMGSTIVNEMCKVDVYFPDMLFSNRLIQVIEDKIYAEVCSTQLNCLNIGSKDIG